PAAHRRLPSFPTRRSSDLSPMLRASLGLRSGSRRRDVACRVIHGIPCFAWRAWRCARLAGAHVSPAELFGVAHAELAHQEREAVDRKSTRLNSSHLVISYA